MRHLRGPCSPVGFKCVDNHNDYYDPDLKESRLALLTAYDQYQHHRVDITDSSALNRVFDEFRPSHVVALAAQAGVRFSIENPIAYVDSNIVGFTHILEACRHADIKHLVYASSSSVYGGNRKVPFSVHDNVDHPVSFYAASKKANELMAHTYSHLFNLPTTGLRFFTVYGPWGRPDMALFKFTKAIIEDEPIDVFNHGNHTRDFTYIDDIVEGIRLVMVTPPGADKTWDVLSPDPGTSFAPWRIHNIGNSRPVGLMDYIAEIERHLGKKATVRRLPMQPGDVPDTYADISALQQYGYEPSTNIEQGIGAFVDWYRTYYQV